MIFEIHIHISHQKRRVPEHGGNIQMNMPSAGSLLRNEVQLLFGKIKDVALNTEKIFLNLRHRLRLSCHLQHSKVPSDLKPPAITVGHARFEDLAAASGTGLRCLLEPSFTQ